MIIFWCGVLGNNSCEGIVIVVLGFGIGVIVLLVLRINIVVVLKCWVIVWRFLFSFCIVYVWFCLISWFLVGGSG